MIREYAVTVQWRREAYAPVYSVETLVVRAYTAQDAMTQTQVNESWRVDLLIQRIEPADRLARQEQLAPREPPA